MLHNKYVVIYEKGGCLYKIVKLFRAPLVSRDMMRSSQEIPTVRELQ